jgi:hypothetical protein
MDGLHRFVKFDAACFLILLFALVATVAARAAQAPGAAPLTDDDVIKMVQMKFGDSVIVAKIKSSACKFDTSMDALGKLKAAGVSDAVMQAMVEPAAPPKVPDSQGGASGGAPVQSANNVFLAGTGNPDRLPDVLDGIAGCLAEKGVTVKQLGAEPKSRGVALDEMKQKGGSYLLFVSLDFAPRVNIRAHMTVQSFDESGKALLEEDINGSMMVTSQSGYMKKMVSTACKKLDAHAGGEGLPKDAPK